MRQVNLDRWVAVKVIDEHDTLKREAILKEGMTQARLAMKHIPQVYDAIEWKNKVYIIMQWIRGVPLSALLENDPDMEQRLLLADALIRTVAELHALGYAHRDIKPANIVISPDDGMYFVDFSFAKDVSERFESMEGTAKGTPAYMAPELWRGGGERDYMRADVYSIGIVLREILPGRFGEDLIAWCVEADPVNRPASGIILFEQWCGLFSETLTPDWKHIAEERTREILSTCLTASAGELVAAGRFDEAYWLLVESIENDPDNAEALELLTVAAEGPGKRSRFVTALYAGGSVAAIAGALALASLFWFTGKIEPRIVMEGETGKKIISLPDSIGRERGGHSFDSAMFLEEPIVLDAVHGELSLVSIPASGYLSFQEGKKYTPEEIQPSFSLPAKKYLLAWHDANGAVIWREKVMLLPFQKKIINIRKVRKS
jgi:serine/threonine protein kinase